MMGVAEADVEEADVGTSFVLLRGSVDDPRGIRIRTMVRMRGRVTALEEGSEVAVRFRPHGEAVAWITFTGLIGLVGLIALIGSLVTGAGPLLWPLAAIAMFGAISVWKIRTLLGVKRQLESDLLGWLTP